MITLEISRSKFIKWINDQLEETESLDDLKYIFGYIPNFVVEKGFNSVQEFLMDANKDNPTYFTFFVKEMIQINSYGADQIDIKWTD